MPDDTKKGEKGVIVKYSDMYVPIEWFLSLTNISKKEFENITTTYQIHPSTEGYPVFAILNAIHLSSRAKEKKIVKEDDIQIELLEKKIMQQKLLAHYIANQSRLNLFVPKAIAELRMTKTCSAVASAIQTAIQTMSPDLLNKTDIREVQEIATNAWNDAIDILYGASDQIEWDDEGDAELMQRKLYQSAGKDANLGSIIDNAYSTEDLNE